MNDSSSFNQDRVASPDNQGKLIEPNSAQQWLLLQLVKGVVALNDVKP